MLVWSGAVAWAQDPMWQGCRPVARPLEAASLVDGPLPPLRPAEGPATPDQAVAGRRLVVTPEGWWLDGAPVTALPALDGVVVAVHRDLPAAEVARLFAALEGSKAQVWTVSDAAGRLPAGSRAPDDLPPVPKGGVAPRADAPPGTIEAWSRVLGQCKPGDALLEVGADCATWSARWRAVNEHPGCLLPVRLSREVQAPVGVGSPTGVAVTPQPIDRARPSWLRPEQTWADVEPGAGWVVVGPPPWGDGLPEPAGLALRDRRAPEWPDGAPKGKSNPDVRCTVEVTVERDGLPSAAVPTGCDDPYAAASREAALRFVWRPPVVEGVPRRVRARVSFLFTAGVASVVDE